MSTISRFIVFNGLVTSKYDIFTPDKYICGEGKEERQGFMLEGKEEFACVVLTPLRPFVSNVFKALKNARPH